MTGQVWTGLASIPLALVVDRLFGDPVELERALIVVMGISDGSALAVVATRPCDIGLVAYEMALLTDRAGAALTPQLVAELRAELPL